MEAKDLEEFLSQFVSPFGVLESFTSYRIDLRLPESAVMRFLDLVFRPAHERWEDSPAPTRINFQGEGGWIFVKEGTEVFDLDGNPIIKDGETRVFYSDPQDMGYPAYDAIRLEKVGRINYESNSGRSRLSLYNFNDGRWEVMGFATEETLFNLAIAAGMPGDSLFALGGKR